MLYRYLVGAVILMCAAHFVRLLRWNLFIELYEKPQNKKLLQALTLGYMLNYIVPLKLGDVVRAWISGKSMKNGKALGFSTVIVDRYLDIITVGIIFIILSVVHNGSNTLLQDTALFYVLMAIFLLVAAIFLYTSKGIVKRLINAFAKIFNKSIESTILCFAWALIWNFKDIFLKIKKTRLILTTMGMWLLYLISYYLFACFLSSGGEGITWIDVFTMLFAQNGVSSSTGNAMDLWSNDTVVRYPIYMIIYMVIPLFILLGISIVLKNHKYDNGQERYLNLLPHLDFAERLTFLEHYFSNRNRDYILNYLMINQDTLIIRDYSAGSNAATMLCMDEKRTFFRKYAVGDDREKLYQQIEWIESHSNKLALPQIVKQNKTKAYCFYDMPYNSHAVSLFEYVHSMPIEKGWKIIQSVLERLEHSIYRVDVRKADKDTIDEYVECKINKNLNRIKNAKRISKLQQYHSVLINGVEYKNLSFYENLLSIKNLEKIFADDTYAVIHGDLTVENIICTRGEDGKDDFYIIDPNTGNIHDSPNLDYGKLLQSIHGGYEFLISTKEVSVHENHINFLFTRSSSYIELHKRLREYMKHNFGKERTRSIYYHEMIHWIRLMPYKIEKDGKRALLFYAGMLMVMNDVIEMYGNPEL